MLHTFKGGIRPKDRKAPTRDKPIVTAAPPATVTIPMAQHTGAPCSPGVKVGDAVKKGAVVGSSGELITSPVHASVSGRVSAIEEASHPVLGKAQAVVISSDGRDEWHDSVRERRDTDSLKPADIAAVSRACGIVGMGGAAFPTHVKLQSPKKIDTVILNCAECEPYLTCDDRLMIERPYDILRGLGLMMKTVRAERSFIAIESNKPEAIAQMEEALREYRKERPDKDIQVIILAAKYPQGSEKQLIEIITRRRVPPRSLPLEVGCLVQNTGTAFALYEAVYKGRPLVERCVTLSGDCLEEPVNVKVRIGTRTADLLPLAGGLRKDVSKVVFGGPMMGIAQTTLDVPVVKGTTGILFLSDEEALTYEEMPCIRCARCVESCPMNLLPLVYAKYAKKGHWEKAAEYNIDDCIECGCCSYVCPSRIPLVQYIKVAKKELFRKRKKGA